MEKKKERISVPSYTLCEELVNSISHGIAAAFSICFFISSGAIYFSPSVSCSWSLKPYAPPD